MQAPKHVYIVADFEPLRLGLSALVSRAADLEVIGEAASLGAMLQDTKYREADVLVVDAEAVNQANMPEIVKGLAEWFPALNVLFVGSQEDGRAIDPDDIPTYMALKTVGFVYRFGEGERLLQAIRLLASGSFVCESEVIRHILTRLAKWATYPTVSQDNLSDRETEVLVMVALGRSNKEISRELFVSEGTVKAHISHIMSKLSLDRRTELVRYALAKGLVQISDEAN